MKVRLGTSASIFYDAETELMVYPGEEVEVTKFSWRVRAALRGGHLVEILEKPVEPEVTTEGDKETPFTEKEMERINFLKMKTVKAIMEEFQYMEEDDLTKAKAIKDKASLVEFFVKAERAYE